MAAFLSAVPIRGCNLLGPPWSLQPGVNRHPVRSIASPVMFGYDPDFLGKDIRVPLPNFSKAFAPDVLTNKDRPDADFQYDYYTKYVNYSIATNKSRRQPIVVALNINQALIKSVKRGPWSLDPQVGPYQLDNSYYFRNVYDRGHLARRSTAAWGRTEDEARAASDATMFYTNACLQHQNFNQDEWLELENWVKYLQDDSTGRISVFSGPIYTRRDPTTTVIGIPPAEIPTAFFKVVCYVNKTGQLSTVAFMMAQDASAISDRNARSRDFDLNAYQVSVKMIEDETGLVFDQKIKETNPIVYTPPPSADPSDFPVITPVSPGDLETGGKEPRKAMHSTGVGILCAMVDVKGNELRGEWITIANFSSADLDLSGWTLSDTKRHPLQLSDVLLPGETKRVENARDRTRNSGFRLNNRAGTIILANPKGDIIDRVSYSTRTRRIEENVPITFHLDEHISSDGVVE